MIISAAPMRLDLAGGGTDLLSYARSKGGVVVNTAIDVRCICTITSRSDTLISLKAPSFNFIGTRSELRRTRDLAGHIVAEYGVDGLDIRLDSDVPAGSGLGGSGAVGTALLRGLAEFNPKLEISNPADLAELASHVEIFELGAPIGKQDQYASAFGGINVMEFHRDDSVKVNPIHLETAAWKSLNAHLILFHLGRTRESGSILSEQNRRSGESTRAIQILDILKSLALEMAKALNGNDLDDFSRLLGEVWSVKKNLSPGITDTDIERFYETALAAGAKSGKVMGAGGGGCFLLFAPPANHREIREALKTYREIPFEISTTGCRIINPT